MTNKEVFIGDSVYFLEETARSGEFPRILKGKVQVIKFNSVQVKVSFSNYMNELWIDLERCYKTAQDLVKDLYGHLMMEAYIVDNPDKEPR